MLRKIVVSLFISKILLLSFTVQSVYGDDDVVQFPDGAYGINIGDGYYTKPSDSGGEQDFVPPQGYRDPYEDSKKYGPFVNNSYLLFPDTKMPGAGATQSQPKKPLDEKEAVFSEFTTSSEASGLWGTSD